ncbi:MAG TPA: L-threonylcarbamoyladenylate synthase [Candidatus Hydrogenedentes bacterium]|nr:L-threonylcarbamoyladenylate synthase [Candidatus Hydrogenedentota bacterium]
MRVVPPTPAGFDTAVDALRRGGLIAYPTETVYGLGADPANPRALERLFLAKGRDAGKAVLLIVGDTAQLDALTGPLSDRARTFVERFWPGPLSLLLPASGDVPRSLVGPEAKLCVRCPSCEIARTLCRVFGGPLTSTSANPAGEPPARSVAGLALSDIAVAVDGGMLPASPPSTIFDPETGRVLREGVIPESALRALL